MRLRGSALRASVSLVKNRDAARDDDQLRHAFTVDADAPHARTRRGRGRATRRDATRDATQRATREISANLVRTELALISRMSQFLQRPVVRVLKKELSAYSFLRSLPLCPLWQGSRAAREHDQLKALRMRTRLLSPPVAVAGPASPAWSCCARMWRLSGLSANNSAVTAGPSSW